MNNKIAHSLTTYRMSFYKPNTSKALEKIEIKYFQEIFQGYFTYLKKKKLDVKLSRNIILDTFPTFTEKQLFNRFTFFPKVGRDGSPITVVNVKSGLKQEFNEDYSATYPHMVSIYLIESEIYITFLRKSNSGCKTIFIRTFNAYLKSIESVYTSKLIGMFCPSSFLNIDNIHPQKLTLTSYIKSSDKAENINPRKIRSEVSFYIKNTNETTLIDSIKKFFKMKINKETLLQQVSSTTNKKIDEIDDARVLININGRDKSVNLNELHKLILEFDITDIMYENKLIDNLEEVQKFIDKYTLDTAKSSMEVE